jgi:4-alpha-glucanotransferase/alpha-amylase
VHFSGWLLGYLLDRYPADMARLGEMVARGQVEMFGGGDTEPVLAAIPERDRRSQLAALSDRLETAFGRRPQGAWLTERVWESAVGPALADSGIRYVTVDDYHFLCAGKHAAELTGHFTTEEGGVRLDLFPISEPLRYRIPFSTAPETIRYLESLAGAENPSAIYFDDIEKLGIWPETYQWVYEKQWLKQFIEGVLASPVIESAHYGAYHAEHRSRGVVYLPATSYIEMNEWTLDADHADVFAALVKQEKDHQRYERTKPFLRGGIWRNFLTRYAEANWMHKRMLGVSGRLAALGAAASPRMGELLHLTQANDAYWHGLFGGLYLPHLRRAVWNALVELESLLDAAAPRTTMRQDFDLDGHDEVFLGNGVLQAVIRDDGLGSIHEFDAFGLRHNFGDTLVRRVEHYYRKIRDGAAPNHGGEGIASAHDRVNFRHPVTAEDLLADALPRSLFLDRIDDRAVRYALQHHDRARVVLGGPEIRKTFSLEANRLIVEYEFGQAHSGAALDIEINLAMPSCDGFMGRYVLDGGVPGGFGAAFTWENSRAIALEDGVLGGRLTLAADRPLQIRAAPHHTVSQSEDGFEKIMQAVTLRLRLPATAALQLTLAVEPLSV